jgi:hypothetical protein
VVFLNTFFRFLSSNVLSTCSGHLNLPSLVNSLIQGCNSTSGGHARTRRCASSCSIQKTRISTGT